MGFWVIILKPVLFVVKVTNLQKHKNYPFWLQSLLRKPFYIMDIDYDLFLNTSSFLKNLKHKQSFKVGTVCNWKVFVVNWSLSCVQVFFWKDFAESIEVINWKFFIERKKKANVC